MQSPVDVSLQISDSILYKLYIACVVTMLGLFLDTLIAFYLFAVTWERTQILLNPYISTTRQFSAVDFNLHNWWNS